MPVKFNVEDNIVYPLQGVGVIESTFEREMKGENVLYFKLKMQESGMFISIPAKNAESMGLRKVIKKKDITQILKDLTVFPNDIEENWKLRYQENIDKLKSGSIDSIVIVVKELFVRNKIKNLSIMERKQFESAFKMLVKEISLASKSSEEDANNLVSEKLDILAEMQEKKTGSK